MGSDVSINRVVGDPDKYGESEIHPFSHCEKGNLFRNIIYIKWMGAEVPDLHEKYGLHNNHCALLRMMFDYFSIKKENWDELVNNSEFIDEKYVVIKQIKKEVSGKEVIILYILYFHNVYDITDMRDIIKKYNGSEENTYLFVSNYPGHNRDIKKIKGIGNKVMQNDKGYNSLELEPFRGKIIIVAY